MAMKTKKERFHVGALNRDLEGEMSREEEEEEEEGRERGGGSSKTHSSTLQAIRWEAKCTEGKGRKKKKTCCTESEKLPKTTHWHHPALQKKKKKNKRLNSPFWSPTRVCFAPKPFPRRLVLRMSQTQTPCEGKH